jgi:hypothetical protein
VLARTTKVVTRSWRENQVEKQRPGFEEDAMESPFAAVLFDTTYFERRK